MTSYSKSEDISLRPCGRCGMYQFQCFWSSSSTMQFNQKFLWKVVTACAIAFGCVMVINTWFWVVIWNSVRKIYKLPNVELVKVCCRRVTLSLIFVNSLNPVQEKPSKGPGVFWSLIVSCLTQGCRDGLFSRCQWYLLIWNLRYEPAGSK